IAPNAGVRSGQQVAASSLFTVTDADNDPITEYRFYDEGTDPSSGYFTVNGVRQAAALTFIVSPAQLSTGKWVSGAGGAEIVWARASDGFSPRDRVSWTMTSANSLPPITAQNASTHGAVAVSPLFAGTDADNDAIAEYRFYDEGTDPGSGYFTVNGVRQAAAQTFVVRAAQLSSVQWVAGTSGSETFWARASDGFGYGDWAFWTMTSRNNPPRIIAPNAGVRSGQQVAASSLFTVTDADNDPITEYRFYDEGTDPSSGYFTVNGVRQAAALTFIVNPAQLSTVKWVSGAGGAEIVWARASDGFSPGDWVSWTMTSDNR